ncbi:MAG: NADH-quinone oxidoreductase subunit M, partial [Proteobacteria bacterium]|nr:NADH-quinone oxidoreductase subunit M [Pseudomonadota bacterium]
MDFGYPVLTLLILFPLVAACGLFFLRAPQVVRMYTFVVSVIELLLAVPLLGYKPNADFQFVERLDWVHQWNLEYFLGVDGISILMVWLTLA